MYQTMLIGVFQLSRTNNLFSKKPITIILLLGTISYFTHYMTLCKPSLLHNKEELTSKCNHTLTNSWAICTASGSYGSYFPIRTLVLQRNEQVIFKEMAPAAEHLIQSRSQFQVPRPMWSPPLQHATLVLYHTSIRYICIFTSNIPNLAATNCHIGGDLFSRTSNLMSNHSNQNTAIISNCFSTGNLAKTWHHLSGNCALHLLEYTLLPPTQLFNVLSNFLHSEIDVLHPHPNHYTKDT